MSLQTFSQHYRQRIDSLLLQHIEALPDLSPNLKAAMRHGLVLGGKRVRPFLVYATGLMLDVEEALLDGPAAAIECIHAYSLIHDDLPAMDDDDLRRGHPIDLLRRFRFLELSVHIKKELRAITVPCG